MCVCVCVVSVCFVLACLCVCECIHMSSVVHGIFFVLTSLDSHSDHPQMCVNVADVPCYDAEFRKKVCWQCCRGGGTFGREILVHM